MALGEFDFESYAVTREPIDTFLAWLVFFVATIISQIIILNMLIAIMSNTFEKVMEMQTQWNLRLRIEILAEYSFLFVDADFKPLMYLFIVS